MFDDIEGIPLTIHFPVVHITPWSLPWPAHCGHHAAAPPSPSTPLVAASFGAACQLLHRAAKRMVHFVDKLD